MCGWGQALSIRPAVYVHVWTPILGDELECRREGDNDFDRYAVAVLRRGVVGIYLEFC